MLLGNLESQMRESDHIRHRRLLVWSPHIIKCDYNSSSIYTWCSAVLWSPPSKRIQINHNQKCVSTVQKLWSGAWALGSPCVSSAVIPVKHHSQNMKPIAGMCTSMSVWPQWVLQLCVCADAMDWCVNTTTTIFKKQVCAWPLCTVTEGWTRLGKKYYNAEHLLEWALSAETGVTQKHCRAWLNNKN